MIGKKINQLATELAPVSTDLTIIGDPISGVSKKITLAQLGAIFSGAVSFYTNLAGFPATGDINVIYCAKDTQKLYLWSGSAYTEVFPSQALLDTYQLRSEKGNANGYASLDSQGKVPISQLPSSIMEYKGTWNASTNTPTLANGTGDTGDVYICNVAGTVNFGAGAITFAVGDYVIYSGSIWQRSSGAVGTVTSVAASITGDSITISGSPVTTSGTLAFAFAGNSTQYINGAGNLVTFPGVINEAQNLITEVYNKTGATLTKGTVVYINGGQGNLPSVTKALATGDSTSAQTYGIVRNDITNNNNGYVVVAGRISDLDTQAYTEGTQLYLSPTTAGTFTSTKPYAPQHLVYVGIVVRAHPTQGVVEVKIQNGYELDELHNVAAQTPSNNDGLFWEASTSLWKNKSIATILGGTPITGSGNVNAIPKFTANSVLGNSVMEDDGNFVSMRSLKINAVGGVGETINFQQGSGITAAGLGYSSIGAASTTGFVFYIDQNTTSRSFILDTSTITSATQLTYSLPASSGTLALVSQLTGGTVTSVGLSSATSGVTIGSTPITTSGTITLAIATASGSQQGLLSSTDWTTFNNKQNALTNPVTGTGTTNYLPKFTGTSTIGNSQVFDNGTNVGIGTTSPSTKLEVSSSDLNTIFVTNPDTSGATTGSGIGFKAYNGTSVTQFAGIILTANSWSFGTYASRQLNIGCDGAGGIGLRTANSAPIIFYTGGSFGGISPESMRLNASGNLSLGNTNDSFKLDVTGTGRFTSSLTTTQLISLSASGSAALFLKDGSANNKWEIGHITNSLYFYNYTRGGNDLILNGSTGAATFSNDIQGGGDLYFNKATRTTIYPTTTNQNLHIKSNGSGVLQLNNDNTGNITMCVGGGSVGIGTTTPDLYSFGGGGRFMTLYNSSGYSLLTVASSSTNSSGLSFGNESIRRASIDGLNGSDLAFATNGSNSGSSLTERMRITSGGSVCIGVTSPTNSQGLFVYRSNFAAAFQTDAGTGQEAIRFFNGSTAVGTIATTSSSTAYNTSSDYRLKQDLKDFNGLDLLTKIKTYDYEWKSDKTRSYGVIAHELQSVINYAVTGVKDGKEMQGVDYSKIVPVLIKSIQEQQQQIEQLKNK